LIAAFAVGSGDGRDGATDARTVEQVPPYALLRIGMDFSQVMDLVGRPDKVIAWPLPLGDELVYCLKPDWFGRRYEVHVHLSGVEPRAKTLVEAMHLVHTSKVTEVSVRLLD
jgi:hypothetical protein